MTTIRPRMTSAITRTVLVLALAATAIGAFWLFAMPAKTADPTHASISIGDAVVKAEIARTPAAREHGLSGHTPLGETEGMLFVMDSLDLHGFWMRDMRFPIDILWLASDGRVVDIKANAAPESYPAIFYPHEPALYVLEVSAGFAARRGVNIGARAMFPRDI